MAGDVLSVDSFVDRVFDRSPKFPRRFSHDGTAVDGAVGGREEQSHCAYLLPSSLDKIVDEDTMAREQEGSQPEPPVVTANRGKGAFRIAIGSAGGGGKESGSRRRSTSGSPHSEWPGATGSGCRSGPRATSGLDECGTAVCVRACVCTHHVCTSVLWTE